MVTMIEYPSAEDYMMAVQRPGVAFGRPELVAADFQKHPMMGIPVPVSGSTAVVFKARVARRDQALRFFTRDDAGTRDRYNALNAWFTQRGLAEDVASCHWVDDAVLVNGRRWPMVQMEWVEGATLDRHVEDLVEDGDQQGLEALAGSWRDLVRRAQAAQFAHGDLQHGNVLVDPTGRPRLVDFDSSWIAPFAGSRPPAEGGHRNYQPVNRVWGAWMDTFPGLVIYLSLLALARDPRQWRQLNTGENLLFRDQDYLPPHRTPAWARLTAIGDPQVDQLAAQLRACCRPDWTATGDLESLLSTPAPWWLRTGTQTSIPPVAGSVPRHAAPPEAVPWPRAVPPQRPGAPWPGTQQQPVPAPRTPVGQSGAWWANTPGAQPGSQPGSPPPAPVSPRSPAGSPESAGRRLLLALPLALLTLIFGTVLLAATLSGSVPPASVVGVSVVVALVPAVILFILVMLRGRGR